MVKFRFFAEVAVNSIVLVSVALVAVALPTTGISIRLAAV